MSAVAVVTGGNRGLGLEVVRQLAQRGDRVVLGSRDVAAGLAAARDLDGEIVVRPLDVTSDESVEALVTWLREQDLTVDVLVNNAGIQFGTWERQDAVGIDLDIVRQTLDVNIVGGWRVTSALVPLMPRGARIVTVSSGAGSFGETAGQDAGRPAYSVSKAGLDMLTVRLAAELRPQGVLVNAVCPGAVATDMAGGRGAPVSEGAQSVLYAVDLPPDGPTGTFTRNGATVPW